MKIHVDFETYSAADLPKVGAYRYANDSSTGIWMLAWAIDEGDPQVWYPGEPVPEEFYSDQATFFAYNAMFERCIWSLIACPLFGFPEYDPRRWHCVMALAAYHNIPVKRMSLDSVAERLGCHHQKDKDGARLMKRMSRPRNQDSLFAGSDNEVQRLAEYCAQDVRVEREVAGKLGYFLPKSERLVWLLDQSMNFRGLQVDTDLCVAASSVRALECGRHESEIESITGGAVSSPAQTTAIREWLSTEGLLLSSISAEEVDKALTDPTLTDAARRVLEIRRENSLSSVAKYSKMLELADDSGRMRDCVQYYGASTTGRWAGRGAQIQNFPRGSQSDMESLAETILTGDRDQIELLYGDPMIALKDCLRGAIVARPGYQLAVWDYAQIEARVLAWLANESMLLNGFAAGRDIYKLFACEIYQIPLDLVGKAHRTVAKAAVLGLGYGMGAERFKKTLALSGVDLPIGECRRIVELYRDMFVAIPALWAAIERCWKKAGNAGMATSFGGVLEFRCRQQSWGDAVEVALVSGRSLFYWNPSVGNGGGTYDAGPYRKSVYGGLLVENLCQAFARDILAGGMVRLSAECDIVGTVHDEILAEVPIDLAEEKLAIGTEILAKAPEWCPDLPLATEGFLCHRYRK